MLPRDRWGPQCFGLPVLSAKDEPFGTSRNALDEGSKGRSRSRSWTMGFMRYIDLDPIFGFQVTATYHPGFRTVSLTTKAKNSVLLFGFFWCAFLSWMIVSHEHPGVFLSCLWTTCNISKDLETYHVAFWRRRTTNRQEQNRFSKRLCTSLPVVPWPLGPCAMQLRWASFVRWWGNSWTEHIQRLIEWQGPF